MAPRKPTATKNDPLESPDPGMAGFEPEGFWTRDENFGKRLDESFQPGEMFLAWDVHRGEPFIHPETGESIDSRTWVTAQGLDPIYLTPQALPERYSTLSGPIFDRAAHVREGDFPAVVKLRKVEVKRWQTAATVMERVCPWPIPQEVRIALSVPPAQMQLGEIMSGDDLSDALEAAAAE